MSRLKKFLVRLLIVVLVLLIISFILFLLQAFFGLFDPQIAWIKGVVTETDAKFSADVFAGISVGTVGLMIVVSFFPVFMKGVNNRQYFMGLRRGVISAFVFYLSDTLYRWLGEINRFYMILTMVIVVIITFILIEVLSLSTKENEEVSFRTDLVSAIVSGLVFGVLLKLFSTIVHFFGSVAG